MKQANKKSGKIKEKVYRSEEQEEIIRFIIILLVVVLVVLGVYFFTKNVVNKTKLDIEETTVTGKVDYTKVTIGTMLGKREKEYYVIAYDSENINAKQYEAVTSLYTEGRRPLSVYFCDLGNALNKEFVAKDGENSNPKAKNINELKLGELTLIKITEGKISKYIEGLDSIKVEFEL